MEMRSLKHLSLEGNRITDLKDETFQNLHSLQLLSLAYNSIRTLNLDAFDYVGSLSYLRLDLSHNRIQSLGSNKTARYTSNSNIRHGYMDLAMKIIQVLFVLIPFTKVHHATSSILG